MFGWRKKSENFDWHTYVRTTIKVRRQARRDRVDAARLAALDKAHAAGQAVAQGSKAGAVNSAKGVVWFGQNVARAFAVAFGPLGEWLMSTTGRAGARLKGLDFAGPLALIGGIALASGLYRWRSVGFDAEAAVPLGLGIVLLLLAAPSLLGRGGVSLPKGIVLPAINSKLAVIGATALALGAGAFALARTTMPGGSQFGSIANISFMPSSAPPVEGRAIVLGGDAIRVNGKALKLSGVEAPDKQQSCSKTGKPRWRCGEAAVTAMEKITRGKTVKCTPSGSPDVNGRTAATCTVDGRDIASELVRGGHIFSTSTMIGGYSSDESEAKRQKVGLWSGDAERPSEYRSKAWDNAKKASPDGCPIKGSVTSNGKVYVLPWANGYAKTIVRTSKGEKWFCSEADAVSAGFKLSEKG